MKNIIFFCILAFIVSCKARDTDTELKLKKCANEKVNDNRIQEKQIDFYLMTLEIERIFLEDNLLENDKRKDYKDLFNDIQNNKNDKYRKVYNIVIDKMSKTGFNFNLGIMNHDLFSKCPYSVSVESKESAGKKVFLFGTNLNNILIEGFDNNEIIEKTLDDLTEKDFKKIVYRAPIILLVMINLDNKYNPDLKKLKEQQGAKDFLNKN